MWERRQAGACRLAVVKRAFFVALAHGSSFAANVLTLFEDFIHTPLVCDKGVSYRALDHALPVHMPDANSLIEGEASFWL